MDFQYSPEFSYEFLISLNNKLILALFIFLYWYNQGVIIGTSVRNEFN